VNDQALFLLIEDDTNDAILLRRAFAKARVLNPLQIVYSAEEAMDYLKAVGKYGNRQEYPLPGLILLDLKLPGMSGHDFLRWLRSDPELRALRVVVLSSSDAIWDVNEAYRAGANSFLIKPADFEKFVEISQALNGYWVWIDKSPEVERPSHQRPAGQKSDQGRSAK
jgi:CheY-like chemotaxis protein